MISTRRETALPLLLQPPRSGTGCAVDAVPDNAAPGVDGAGLDSHLAVVFELIHRFLGGVVMTEEKPEESRRDDGRDADPSCFQE